MPGKLKDKLKWKFKSRFIAKFIMILILILLILTVTVFLLKVIIPGFDFTLPFTYNRKTSSTEIILKEIHKVATLSTVEYIYKSVFPFDFLDPDTNWRAILLKRTKGDFLTEPEVEKLWIFDECREIGINLEHKNYDFVVITSIVGAGLDLGEDISPGDIEIEGKNISLRIPKTIITDFTIEDSDSSSYNYPDLNVDPMNWKKITNYVEGKIRLRVIEDGILKSAEKRGKDFIESILIESGWENVTFAQ